MKLRKYLAGGAIALATMALSANTAYAACATDSLPATKAKPAGYPARALTMIVPYGPAGGSGQVAQAMAQAVSDLTGISINRDHKPGGSGAVGTTAYLAAPADGYTVLEHIDDASSAHALDSSKPNPATDLIPLVISQITFSQVYIRTDEDRFSDWNSFVKWVKAQDGKATIANVSKEGSMERITMKFITDATGMKIQQISFDKGAPRYGALAGGQVDALFEQPGDVRKFLDAGKFKPILTVLKERPAAFANVPSLTDAGLNFDPLYRFRGFYVHKDTPADRVAWLQWAFQKAYCQPSYQKYNESKYMSLIESYRDTAGARELITSTVKQYRDVYKAMGLEVK
ncbi:MAG: tripartite tricarboxylate transporter substrate binding protein [Gammaproteobacteria bacterium]|nr:tripartite tricarboxylate transporter substrate binding protein [Gammaproteobacteria bacterium]MDH3535495.1 tripartite tricarboxylate transporter substrate binding protein [Gammaproteobacteria bacterium]